MNKKFVDIFENVKMIDEEVEKSYIDPKFLLSVGHKKENVKGIWWYSLETGELRISSDFNHIHAHDFFKDVAFKPGWIRGRVFKLSGKMYLIVYLGKIGRITSNQLLDIIDKTSDELRVEINYAIDKEGNDLSYLLESVDKSIKTRFGIECYGCN